MTVLAVREKFKGADGDAALKKDGNYWIVARKRTKSFLVHTDGYNDTTESVELARGVPRLWSPFTLTPEVNIFLVCKRIQSRQLGQRLWQVDCDYDDDWDDQDKKDSEDDPLARTPKIRYSARTIELRDNKDIHGNLIKNSAGTLYKDPPPKHIPCMVFTITRNEASFDALRMAKYYHRTNSGAWYKAQKHQAFIDNIEAEETSEKLKDGKKARYYAVTYVILVLGGDKERKTGNLNLWRPTRLLDKGPFTFGSLSMSGPLFAGGTAVGANDHPPELARDANGVAHGKDVLLDGKGHELAPGKDPVFLEYDMVWDADFNRLKLP